MNSAFHRVKSELFAALLWILALAVIATGPFLLLVTYMCLFRPPGACS